MTRILLAAALAALTAGPAFAEPAKCGPVNDIEAEFAKQYHEAPVWIGQDGRHNPVVLIQSPGGATWTLLLLLTTPDHRAIACPIGAGTTGAVLPPSPPPDNSVPG